MTRFRLLLAASLCSLAWNAPAVAQGPVVTLGVGAGAGTLPAALRVASEDPAAPDLGVGAEVRLAVGRLGPLSVEGRLGVHSGSTQPYVVNPNDPDSPSIVRERSTVTGGPQAFWDVRLRVEPEPMERSRPVFTLGAGLMTENVRFVAGSLGHRWAGGRVGLDLEVAAYELRWQRVVVPLELDYPDEVFTFGRASVTYPRRWHLGVGLRLVYELRLTP